MHASISKCMNFPARSCFGCWFLFLCLFCHHISDVVFIRRNRKLSCHLFMPFRLEILRLQGLQKKFWGQFHDLCVQNKGVYCEVETHFGSFRFARCMKKFWAQFHDLCVQKRSCLPWSSDAVWKYSVCKVYRKSSGGNFTIYASKTKPFAVKLRRILEVFALRGAWKSSERNFTIYASKTKLFDMEKVKTISFLVIH